MIHTGWFEEIGKVICILLLWGCAWNPSRKELKERWGMLVFTAILQIAMIGAILQYVK